MVLSLTLIGVQLTPTVLSSVFFFFNDTATTEIYTLSLHDALPIYRARTDAGAGRDGSGPAAHRAGADAAADRVVRRGGGGDQAGRHQYQHAVAGRGPPGAHAVRGVLRRGVLPPLLRRAARAHPAAEPRLR